MLESIPAVMGEPGILPGDRVCGGKAENTHTGTGRTSIFCPKPHKLIIPDTSAFQESLGHDSWIFSQFPAAWLLSSWVMSVPTRVKNNQHLNNAVRDSAGLLGCCSSRHNDCCCCLIIRRVIIIRSELHLSGRHNYDVNSTAVWKTLRLYIHPRLRPESVRITKGRSTSTSWCHVRMIMMWRMHDCSCDCSWNDAHMNFCFFNSS